VDFHISIEWTIRWIKRFSSIKFISASGWNGKFQANFGQILFEINIGLSYFRRDSTVQMVRYGNCIMGHVRIIYR
jgi:hypothetical protein